MSVVEIPGVSYRQLDYWCRRGYLRPVHTGGSGAPRRWTQAEVDIAQLMARLVAAGLPPLVAEQVARGKPDIGPGITVVVAPVPPKPGGTPS